MDKECTESGDNFTFSYFEYDDGPYFDMDFNLPFYGNISPSEEDNKESNEFEFSVSVSTKDKPDHHVSEPIIDVSPADDLFYKGQLLPLHLPPRLQMVRNLSMPRESEPDKYVSLDNSLSFQTIHEDFHSFSSSGSEDSNERPISCKEVEFSSYKTEKTHFQSIVKPATKFKVSLFGFRKPSKVGMDDHLSTKSSPLPVSPSPPKHHKFSVKPMKAPVRFFAKNHSTESQKSPDYSSRSTGAKHVLQKYLRMMKHRVSQRHDHSLDDQQLQVEDECGWNCVAGESGRRTHISWSGNLKMGSRSLGLQSCPPSMNSSPNHNRVLTNFYCDDLQSAIQAAIAYCKQSNGITDTHISMDSECPSQRFTSSHLSTTHVTDGAKDFH